MLNCEVANKASLYYGRNINGSKNMWPFNRANKISGTSSSQKAQQQYDNEYHERVGLAWLIAFISLIVTVMVVVGLFFWGRWTYRKITKSGEQSSGQTAVTDQAATKTSTSPSRNSNKPTTSSKPTVQKNSSAPKHPPTKNLTNTGPGSTITIFVAVSTVGTILHWAYFRQRQSTTE